jgi:hypothetical protein
MNLLKLIVITAVKAAAITATAGLIRVFESRVTSRKSNGYKQHRF